MEVFSEDDASQNEEDYEKEYEDDEDLDDDKEKDEKQYYNQSDGFFDSISNSTTEHRARFDD